ncbi:hypothetical protein MmiAt1_15010 [Methanimicrococcus sp. At1]|uniref:Bacterial repeat domain-containing protein n=1 Tax=Methanimicrococcus hacksteinii TaxID=3028293 RepID=A0ABU3VSL5_9EURY|nr:InlB B-repeat-containing protein [Methanimicrococcus sp. At1]MDV0445900.1 hypothetical protein [Methanimicrococcus sp. At1]
MKQTSYLFVFFIFLSAVVLLSNTGAAAAGDPFHLRSELAPDVLRSLTNDTAGITFYFADQWHRSFEETLGEEYGIGSVPVHLYQITKELTADNSLPGNLNEKAALYKTYYVEPQSSESSVTVQAADFQEQAKMKNWKLNSSFQPDSSSGFGQASGETADIEFGSTREINFYFDMPDWEYAVGGVGIGISDLNQTTYADESGKSVDLKEVIVYNTPGIFYTASSNPGNNQKNDHITYIWLGSDINQNEMRKSPTTIDDLEARKYACFDINLNKSGLIFDGSTVRSFSGAKIGIQETREEYWHKWVQWFHTSAYDTVAVMAVRASVTNTVPFEVKIQNSYLVGGNGYGFIFVSDGAKNVTNHYSNTFYVGPQLFWNDYGMNILDDTEVVIDDPRYKNNGVIHYEDISGSPKSLTLNLNDSRDAGPAYWGEVGEVSGLIFRGNVTAYKTNTGDIVSFFWIRDYTQDVVIEEDAVVNLRYKNNNTDSLYSGIFYFDPSVSVIVGRNAVFNANCDNTFTATKIKDLVLEENSRVTIAGSGNPVITFLNVTGNLEMNQDSELTVFTTHRNAYRVFNLGGSALLKDYSNLNVTGNSNNSAMFNASNLTLNPYAKAKIVNNGFGTALQMNNLTADDFSEISVALMSNTTNASANVFTLRGDRVENAVFYNAGSGRGLNIRSASSGNLNLTNMTEIKHWMIPNSAGYDSDSGIVSGTPSYNWSQDTDSDNGFNAAAWVNAGGWIQSADRLVSSNYTGDEVLNNTTFSLVEWNGSVWNNKTTVTMKGQTGPFSVTLHWNDLNQTINGGDVRYGLPVSTDLDLNALEPVYPYHNFVQWYSDSALTDLYDIDQEPVTHAIHLYGEWESDGTVFVHYKANGGSGVYAPVPVMPPEKHIVLSNSETSFKRDGYNFSNWNTQSDGSGLSCSPGDELEMIEDTDLYAQWVLTEYSIYYTFKTESGADLVTQGTSDNPDKYTVLNTPMTLKTASAPGYTFLRWSDENNLPVSGLEAGSTGERRLTAVFSDRLIVYSLVYDFKTVGGSSLLVSGLSNNPGSYTVADTPLVLNSASASGYTFMHWENSLGEIVTEIEKGSAENYKLTAVFEDTEVSYEIRYRFETESGKILQTGSSSNPDSYTISDTPLVLKPASADGYSFLNWENETGSVLFELDAGSTGNRELTAVFSDREVIYSLIYEFKTQNGNPLKTTGSTENPKTYTVSETPIVLKPASAPGYTFMQWTDENGSVTAVPAGSTGSKTLTAVFNNAEVVYKIEYTFETMSGKPLSVQAFSNNPASYTVSDTPLALNASTADGYSFLYWKDETNSAVSDLPAGSTGGRKLTAVFSDDESVFGIAYKFETENGQPLKTSGSTDNPRSYTVSDTPIVLKDAQAPGYQFMYWKNETNSAVSEIEKGSTGGRQLTAVFNNSELRYQISYLFKTELGNSLSTPGSSLNPSSYTVSDTPLTLKEAAADGYNFLYWTDENGLEISGLDAQSTGNRILTAVFDDSEIIYSITYDFKTKGGLPLMTSGSSSNPDKYTVSDTPVVLSPGNAPGYKFLHWADEDESVISELAAGSFGNRMLTAVFDDEEVVYRIDYVFKTKSGKPLAVFGTSDNPKTYSVSDTPVVLNAAEAAGYAFLYWTNETGSVINALDAGSTGNRELTAIFSDDEIIYTIIYEFETVSGDSLLTTPSSNNPSRYTVSDMPFKLKDADAPGYLFLHWENETGAVISEVSSVTRVSGSSFVRSDLDYILLHSDLLIFADLESYYPDDFHQKSAESDLERTRDRDLTAVFSDQPTVYKITYVNADSSEHNNPLSYTVEETIVLENASRKNYRFEGWYKDSKLSEEITQIGPKMTGDLSIYADWSENNSSGGSGGGSGGGTGGGSVSPSEPDPSPGPGPEPEPEPGPETPDPGTPDPEPPEGGNEMLQTVVILLFLTAVCVFVFVQRELEEEESDTKNDMKNDMKTNHETSEQTDGKFN